MRRAGGRFMPACAVILLLLISFATLHAAFSLHATTRHCPACLALRAPALAQAACAPAAPTAPPAPVVAAPGSQVVPNPIPLLKPLRAPPESPVA